MSGALCSNLQYFVFLVSSVHGTGVVLLGPATSKNAYPLLWIDVDSPRHLKLMQRLYCQIAEVLGLVDDQVLQGQFLVV